MTCDFAFRNAIMIYVESIYREINKYCTNKKIPFKKKTLITGRVDLII